MGIYMSGRVVKEERAVKEAGVTAEVQVVTIFEKNQRKIYEPDNIPTQTYN